MCGAAPHYLKDSRWRPYFIRSAAGAVPWALNRSNRRTIKNISDSSGMLTFTFFVYSKGRGRTRDSGGDTSVDAARLTSAYDPNLTDGVFCVSDFDAARAAVSEPLGSRLDRRLQPGLAALQESDTCGRSAP